MSATAREVPGRIEIRLENAGQEEHFIYLGRLPEGKTFEDYRQEILPPFNAVWELDREEAKGAFMGAFPEWFASTEVSGGPGIVAPGRTAYVTVTLDPGTYAWVMEAPTDRSVVRAFTVE